MELKFNTDQELRKLVFVYNLIGPPNSITRGMQGYPMFFGKNFFLATQIYTKVFESKDRDKIWRILLGGKDKKMALEKAGMKDLAKLLTGIDIETLDPKDEFFATTAASLEKDWERQGHEAERLVRSVFGAKLPESITLLLTEFYGGGTQGGKICDDPVVLSYSRNVRDERNKTGGNNNSWVPVLIHETLHSILGRNGLIQRRWMQGSSFEEALLDFFCPMGMLTEKLGFHERQTLEEYQKYNVRNRPSSKEMSDRLMPYMKKYHEMIGKMTVWEFLKGGGFEDVIDFEKVKSMQKAQKRDKG
jgi:hypothetical protein